MIELAAGERFRVEQGDALLRLSEIADATIDAVITDPPYSSGGQFRGDRTATAALKYTTKIDYGDFDGDTRDARGFLAWSSLWLAECWRAAKPGAAIACFIDWRMLPTMTDAIQAGGWIWRGVVPWHKVSCRNQLGRFAAACEYVVWGSKGPLDQDRGVGCLPGWIECTPVHHTGRVHMTEKPIPVMRAVSAFCNPGGLILDPFAGSGSTGVAAVLDGRRFIGLELAASNVEITATVTPMSIDFCIPRSTWANTSWPRALVPNQCAVLGGVCSA